MARWENLALPAAAAATPTAAPIDDLNEMSTQPTPATDAATTNATDGSVVQSDAMSVAAAMPAAKPPDFYAPQHDWSRRLGPMSSYGVSVLNQCLPQ